MTTFLANENISRHIIDNLRQFGFVVEEVSRLFPGASDSKVLSYASEHKSVILTFDRDYGELIYVQKQPAPLGLIYLRIPGAMPEICTQALLAFLDKPEFYEGYFVVVDQVGFRRKPLPAPGEGGFKK